MVEKEVNENEEPRVGVFICHCGSNIGGLIDCKKLAFLALVHNDGHIKNLKMIKNNGMEFFLKGKRFW